MADHLVLFRAAVLVLVDDDAAVTCVQNVIDMSAREKRRRRSLDRRIVVAGIGEFEVLDINRRASRKGLQRPQRPAVQSREAKG